MKIANLFKGDKAIWAVFLFLCLISIVEVFSASSTLTYKTQNYLRPLIYHSGTILVGVVVAIITLNIPCRYFKLITPVMLFVTYATLLGVLIWGQSINGANRVIQLPGFTFQPSELAKGTMVLATAQILSAMQRPDGSGADPKAMKYVLVVTVPAVLLIAIENLSTGVLLFGVIYIMMFIGRVPTIQMGKLTGVLVLLAGLFMALVFSMASLDKEGQEIDAAQQEGVELVAKQKNEDKSAFEKVTHRFWTWKNRLTKRSTTKGVSPEEYDIKGNYQVAHANFAIASSNIIGKGPGNSVERDYLPQAFSDFIFAIIIEEMGLIGAIAVVLLYVILLFRVARIAGRCENNFPAFLIMGLALLLVCQAVINMMVATDFGIVTGQPLPLVSKGGTSTIVNCAYIGAILSVSRSAKKTLTKTAI
ncbi:MAG: FtsW/RodA/SpoVE family cell cycle protein [Prevotella sp.]|nr:FtsW/RodA/SpoVE family cell cycle protein [Prevotella sp.]MBQ9646602.1 FtsW/RodA/SpoVE family cell cycle protein [Prevotella sp.]